MLNLLIKSILLIEFIYLILTTPTLIFIFDSEPLCFRFNYLILLRAGLKTCDLQYFLGLFFVHLSESKIWEKNQKSKGYFYLFSQLLYEFSFNALAQSFTLFKA